MKTFSLISNLNVTWCNLRPFLLILSLVTWEKRPLSSHKPGGALHNTASRQHGRAQCPPLSSNFSIQPYLFYISLIQSAHKPKLLLSTPAQDHMKDPKHQAARAQPEPSHLMVQAVVAPALSHNSTGFTNALHVTTSGQLLCSLKKLILAMTDTSHSGIQLHNSARYSAPPHKYLCVRHQNHVCHRARKLGSVT